MQHTIHDMPKKMITNHRVFLRNYKLLKTKLLLGEFKKIVIQDNGHRFEFKNIPATKQKKHTFAELLTKFKEEKPQKRIERLDLNWSY